MDLIYHLKK